MLSEDDREQRRSVKTSIALSIASSQRFSRSDIALVFLGIAFTKIERLASQSSTYATLRAAPAWLTKTIQSEIVLRDDRIEGVIPFGAGRSDEVILRNLRDCLDSTKFPLLIDYPLDGFIVASTALSNSRHAMTWKQERRKHVVFLRFLFHLDNSVSYSKENGNIQSHAAKMLTLRLDNASGPRSLFKWQSLRKFTPYLKSLEQFREHLRETVTLDKYRLSLATTDLLNTPLLSSEALDGFRRLEPLFSWIESGCSYAIAVFVHSFMRFSEGDNPAEVLFLKLRECSLGKGGFGRPSRSECSACR
ncbi:hypothetical protein O1611_g558 [Lasiodiplodia mahajangana]|uniref:Uncharacterized protein n=1 Tax=Lasiodiplodia mahajangana TaxID=1108764 RepID=A0ACC2K0S7_9PEZI|nr:hypothetical protein O1611_g558 [Lasiodiplodia mahajangana]